MDLERTAILLTAHPKQQKWWEPVLLALERYPGPLILVYDDIDLAMIPQQILDRFQCATATGYEAGFLGQGRGELVCLREGFAAAGQFDIDYCLKLGFDEPPWRWRNISFLIDLIERGEEQIDCIDCETRIIFGRPQILHSIMTVADVVERGPGAAENYWKTSAASLGIRRKFIAERKFWEHNLGLLHLQGEYAANIGQPNSWSWTIGELWPRGGQS